MKERLTSLDALRGIVMIIMALDHVRDFFHSAAMSQLPTNMATTTPAIFLTRWITHFCAPVFLFTAGASAFLWMSRGNHTKGQLSRFLVTRGLWLILLELTVMKMAMFFTLSPKYPVLLITLWALGGSMIVLAALIHLPVRLLAGFSAAVILLHNLIDSVQASSFGAYGWLWNLLHQPGAFKVDGLIVSVGYPMLPLVATMAAGDCAGHLFQKEPAARQRFLLRLGTAMIVLFALMRAINIYGDPSRWAVQKSGVMTALSYLNCTKYPASADFLLMTLGPALILLMQTDRDQGCRNRTHCCYFRPNAALLFRGSFLLDSLPPGGIHLVSLRQCAVPASSSAVNGRAAKAVPDGLRLRSVGRLSGVGVRGSDHVPAVPLVCRLEAAKTGLVAQLSITSPCRLPQLIGGHE